MKNYNENSNENHIWTINESNFQAKNGFSIATYTNDDLTQVRHSHTYFQIYLVNKGSMIHSVDSQEVVLGQGDIFIITPNLFHRVCNATQNELQFTAINFEPAFLSYQSLDNDFLSLFINFISNTDKTCVFPKISLESNTLFTAMNIISQMETEFAQTQLGFVCYIQGLLTQLLVVLARGYTKIQQHKHDLEAYRETRDIIVKCVAYIDNNYTKDIHLNDVAQQFMLSRTNFCKYFKLYMGTTFNAYVSSRKIEYAKELLRTGSLSIAQIAVITGFNDVTTFSRRFKNNTGVSPNVYRKNQM